LQTILLDPHADKTAIRIKTPWAWEMVAETNKNNALKQA